MIYDLKPHFQFIKYLKEQRDSLNEIELSFCTVQNIVAFKNNLTSYSEINNLHAFYSELIYCTDTLQNKTVVLCKIERDLKEVLKHVTEKRTYARDSSVEKPKESEVKEYEEYYKKHTAFYSLKTYEASYSDTGYFDNKVWFTYPNFSLKAIVFETPPKDFESWSEIKKRVYQREVDLIELHESFTRADLGPNVIWEIRHKDAEIMGEDLEETELIKKAILQQYEPYFKFSKAAYFIGEGLNSISLAIKKILILIEEYRELNAGALEVRKKEDPEEEEEVLIERVNLKERAILFEQRVRGLSTLYKEYPKAKDRKEALATILNCHFKEAERILNECLREGLIKTI